MGLKTRWMELLGYAGLIPFVGLGILSLSMRGQDLVGMFAQINLVYATTIISFLGAVHWGLVLGFSSSETASYTAGKSEEAFETSGLIWGVAPSLMAWITMSFAPSDYVLWIMCVILAFVWLVDRIILKPLKAFEDYLRLRNHLTIGAIAGLSMTAVAT